MSEHLNTFCIWVSRWAKPQIHSAFGEVDERKRLYIHTCWKSMSENADTFTRFGNRWARMLIHSHFWKVDERNRWYIHTFGPSINENANTFTHADCGGRPESQNPSHQKSIKFLNKIPLQRLIFRSRLCYPFTRGFLRLIMSGLLKVLGFEKLLFFFEKTWATCLQPGSE